MDAITLEMSLRLSLKNYLTHISYLLEIDGLGMLDFLFSCFCLGFQICKIVGQADVN